jgi:YHS domain-containing protein
MNLIRRSAWAAVMLGVVAGCTGGEEETGSSPPPVSKTGPVGDRPINKPADKPGPSNEAGSKDMQPPPPPPEEGKKAGEQPKLEPPKAEGKADTAAAKLTPDEIANVKQLSAADQDLALKQAVCPVSDEHLGEMGKPYKLSVEGRTVFLCCENCQKDIKAEPKKYLAKLDAQAKK